MKALLIALGAIALIGSAVFLFNHHPQITIPNINTEIPFAIYDEFNTWTMTYNKEYTSAEERVYRLGIWFANYLMIKAQNQLHQEFTLGPNQFMDLTSAEFVSTYLGYNPEDRTGYGLPMAEPVTAPPTSVNWVTKGDVSAIKNQGQCGACWAFSTTGSLESDDAIFGTGLGDFSEQQLVDCSTSYGNHGCNGGLMDDAFNYVIANGITTEQAYPYTGVQGKCKVNGGAFKIKSYTNIPKGNCNSLQAAVAQQPTSIAVDAQTWQFYTSGVFSLCGTSLDHGVLAVGYQQGTYWLVKNSWGTTWGLQGYIQLKWGNTCGLCNQASYPNLS